MDIMSWIPAVSMSTVLTVLGFAVGTVYKSKIETSLKGQVDARLEKVKASFRREEDKINFEYRRQGEQIAALQQGALSGLVSRRQVLDNRRLAAIETVWAATLEQARDHAALRMIATIAPPAYDGATIGKQGSDKIRALGDIIWKTGSFENRPPAIKVDQERPFVSQSVWALFSAHRQVYAYAMAQLLILRTGTGSRLLGPPEPTVELVKAALPHYASLLDEHGIYGAYEVVRELQDKILDTICADLNDKGENEGMVGDAASIIELARKASDSLEVAK